MRAGRSLHLPVALALVLAACGGGQQAASQGDTGNGGTAGQQAAGTDSAAAAPAPAPPGTTISVVASDEYGPYLVDGEGRTLYRFDADAPGQTNCDDACVAQWPPLATSGGLAPGDGADLTLLGTLARPDGSIQAMYADWPLYHFVQDAAPGDINGQGVGDVWWTVGPDGSKITAAPAAAPAEGEQAAGDGGYGGGYSSGEAEGGTSNEPPQAAQDITITSAYSPEFGTYLTDGEGRPLYRSSADECAVSNCTGACAERWPAVTLEGTLQAGGEVDQALLETFARPDGTTQAMVADWPIYTFTQDQPGGLPNGHGANDGQWSLINLNGKRKDA